MAQHRRQRGGIDLMPHDRIGVANPGRHEPDADLIGTQSVQLKACELEGLSLAAHDGCLNIH